jgi:hypothetical protein
MRVCREAIMKKPEATTRQKQSKDNKDEREK